jgi:ubiquinone/menaquinone biosynthesis C-methylase UbiE
MGAVIAVLGAIVAAALGYALYWRKNPSACPYAQRFWVEIPHPVVSRRRFARVIGLKPGERTLEIGPGTGYFTPLIARSVSPGGRHEIFDLQQKMLDHTMRKIEAAGLSDVVTATQGDATELPFEDNTFDAVTMCAVLGEIPDQGKALSEIFRVLKPGGRFVIGEMVLDPHYVRRKVLRFGCKTCGLEEIAFDGPRSGYFARFEKP